MLCIILLSLFLISILWLAITLIINPTSKLLHLIISWKYRTLFNIRKDYLYGLRCNPPTCYEYFYSRALDILNNESNSKIPLVDRQDIANMLSFPDYIHHYFVNSSLIL